MPTVTRDTPATPVQEPPGPGARLRRLVGSARDSAGIDPSGLRALDVALARYDAPLDLRIRGGLGSGRRTLAAALRVRRGWRAGIDDVDVLAAPGHAPGPAPDVEILCLRTAPCRHEERWSRAPRVHRLLTVATGIDPRTPPAWARDLPAVDARDPEHRSLDAVTAFVDRAVADLATVRARRLEAELEVLAVRPGIGDLAEAALCALHGTGRS